MAKVSIGETRFDSVEVDLWGTVFKTKPVTRSVAKKGAEFDKRIEEADTEGDVDALVAALAEMLDHRLESTNGGRKKPSKIISEKWEADDLSLVQLTDFSESLQEAERPS